jgi:hypothetical protein
VGGSEDGRGKVLMIVMVGFYLLGGWEWKDKIEFEK